MIRWDILTDKTLGELHHYALGYKVASQSRRATLRHLNELGWNPLECRLILQSECRNTPNRII
jgi:hypothetical protein